ncbi:MAG: NAD-dependent deacylase [Phycisphaeraceae bacterium]|nr:NAD-dependent deacylase [Phycisphaerae bacterium]MBX3393266.1 NAD-dependent deacylase [Phycisphaeraceae bacterium]
MGENDSIGAIARAVRDACRLVVLTGAGVSAESGTPTFRDAMTGLWASFNPEQLATPEAFDRDPELVTRWYDHRRLGCMACEPNPGHRALAELERRVVGSGRSFLLLTQNVDRLHQRAGSNAVVELHGTIMVWRCTKTGREVMPPPTPMSEYPTRTEAGGLLRPCVVWFGEMLPESALEAALSSLGECDVFLSVGTSALVQPAAGFVFEARRAGAVTCEINPQDTAITGWIDHAARGPSGRILPAIVEAAFGDGAAA